MPEKIGAFSVGNDSELALYLSDLSAIENTRKDLATSRSASKSPTEKSALPSDVSCPFSGPLLHLWASAKLFHTSALTFGLSRPLGGSLLYL